MVDQQLPSQLLLTTKKPLYCRKTFMLLLIVLLAAALRLISLGQSPPGLNQDEATNAWNTQCLLKTGKDQVGKSWPIFYTRGLGGNRSTLFIYLSIPFQAIGGLNILTMRLPAAVVGIAAVLLIYLIAKRLFDQNVALLAALLLALNPWQLYQSRWGHEASVAPLFGIVPLAMLLWANMPIQKDKLQTPRPIIAAFAGAITGICCYGYHAIRIFIPTFLLLAILLTLPEWWRQIKTRKGALAIAAFAATFALTFGPLAWQHIFHPEGIARHAQYQPNWIGSDPLSAALKNIPLRYIRHFSLEFLFMYQVWQCHWYMLPLMILGLITLIRRLRSSYAARILLVLIITYPVGDSLVWRCDINHFRTSPGLCSLFLLAAFGAVTTGAWLWNKNRILASIIVTVLAVTIVGINIRYLYFFYGQYNHQRRIYHINHCDLLEACRWLRPRFEQYDAVFCTTKGMNMPYVLTLVAMKYDPQQWFDEPRDIDTPGEWDFYNRYGKMYFMYDDSFRNELQKLQQQGLQRDRVLFIVRPGELGRMNIIHKIVNPNGLEVLWLCHP